MLVKINLSLVLGSGHFASESQIHESQMLLFCTLCWSGVSLELQLHPCHFECQPREIRTSYCPRRCEELVFKMKLSPAISTVRPGEIANREQLLDYQIQVLYFSWVRTCMCPNGTLQAIRIISQQVTSVCRETTKRAKTYQGSQLCSYKAFWSHFVFYRMTCRGLQGNEPRCLKWGAD